MSKSARKSDSRVWEQRLCGRHGHREDGGSYVPGPHVGVPRHRRASQQAAGQGARPISPGSATPSRACVTRRRVGVRRRDALCVRPHGVPASGRTGDALAGLGGTPVLGECAHVSSTCSAARPLKSSSIKAKKIDHQNPMLTLQLPLTATAGSRVATSASFVSSRPHSVHAGSGSALTSICRSISSVQRRCACTGLRAVHTAHRSPSHTVTLSTELFTVSAASLLPCGLRLLCRCTSGRSALAPRTLHAAVHDAGAGSRAPGLSSVLRLTRKRFPSGWVLAGVRGQHGGHGYGGWGRRDGRRCGGQWARQWAGPLGVGVREVGVCAASCSHR